jgi:predicted ABC-type exoprotein transport system permease subunit
MVRFLVYSFATEVVFLPLLSHFILKRPLFSHYIGAVFAVIAGVLVQDLLSVFRNPLLTEKQYSQETL